MRKSNARDLGVFEKLWLDAKAWVRKALVSDVRVQDGRFVSAFVCENRLQAYRAITLWAKEPGTMAWIDQSVRSGDRFLDIGANVGIYTISAGHRVGDEGHVYAVEPHKPSSVALLRNIARNGFHKRTTVFTCALADKRMLAPFNYTSFEPSVTGSQLGSAQTNGSGKPFSAAATEICLAVSVDELIEAKAMEPPDLVKIDVDGIELAILKGMAKLLGSSRPPRAVQVELNVGEQDAIVQWMKTTGYELHHRHFTSGGERALREGRSVESIAHNAVFSPVGDQSLFEGIHS